MREALVDNGGCPGNGWSVITSAPTNSQLAGVLAGFVFTGIIILFGRPGAKNTQTLGLFAATFVVLGLDSYLFSLVSGGNTDPMCARVWSEAMAASGMLAAGAMALIGGIRWLLSHHLDDDAVELASDSKIVDLDRLSRFMLYGVATTVMLLLARTALDYFEVVFGNHGPGWLRWLVSLSPVAVGVVAAWLGWKRARREADGSIETAKRSSSATALGLLIYAVIGTVFAGTLTSLPTTWWSPTPMFFVLLTMVVGLVVPAVLVVALVLSAPRPAEPVVEAQPVETEGADGR
ncbi:hypothetical protein [Lentzea sp. NPDC051838]|uniref:hypothetical protein n=1 Tax=Lentzea sp. NPDC051838 TaxID=3154849 RepID=UPI0034360314